jgi:hypothetical protein
VRILEALEILEAAVLECKTREIDTPEVREALDVLAPYCRPEWRVAGFRNPPAGKCSTVQAPEMRCFPRRG